METLSRYWPFGPWAAHAARTVAVPFDAECLVCARGFTARTDGVVVLWGDERERRAMHRRCYEDLLSWLA